MAERKGRRYKYFRRSGRAGESEVLSARREVKESLVVSMCGHKIGYWNRKHARHTARIVWPDFYGEYNIYRCSVCGFWHYGHISGLERHVRAWANANLRVQVMAEAALPEETTAFHENPQPSADT